MDNEKTTNNIDNNVDNEIYECLNPSNPKSFFLFAGAGSGKTRSLVNVLERFKDKHGKDFRLYRKRIAIITYTNAAADEIIRRLEYDDIFQVSTIHSFAWELIKPFTKDIKSWLKTDLKNDIAGIQQEQSKSRDLKNKTSIERARKIESKQKRLQSLDKITKFIYNPNGDNISKDSLNHTEVISITSNFIKTKSLMQDIVISLFPVILVDESQDTKKEMVEALFKLQANKKDFFSLGLFGDMMQRIYGDGKASLDKDLPDDWQKPSKQINHRSDQRIIQLINDIRKDADNQIQIPRSEKAQGYVRLFISDRHANKRGIEQLVTEKMIEQTGDALWNLEGNNVKCLILEHHMAASRLGFLDLYEPLYKNDKLKTSLLNGSLSGLNLFIKIVLPLVEANRKKDKFSIARIVKEHCFLLSKEHLINSKEQSKNIGKVNEDVTSLLALWSNNQDPRLTDILELIKQSALFEIPYPLNIIISSSDDSSEKKEHEETDQEEETDDIIESWDKALQTKFSQVEKYAEYFSEKSQFDTHQGVKGLQYPRVMVILDDEEARGFLFSYDKLFGAIDLSKTDKENIKDGKESSIDRTRRLFYVACSRAEHSLAVVAYTSNPEAVKNTAINKGWFSDKEIEIIRIK